MTVVVWSDQIVGPPPLNCECPSVGELNNGSSSGLSLYSLVVKSSSLPALSISALSRILALINTLTMLVVEISL